MFGCEFQSLIIHRWYILVFALIFMMPIAMLGQDASGDSIIVAEAFQSNSVREEVQRYFGYEDLFYRYLTLPYDINQNVNQVGRHVDLGFSFLALIPVLFLVLVYDNKKWFYGLMISFSLYLMLAWSYSHVRIQDQKIINNHGEGWEELLNSSEQSFSTSLLTQLYNVSYTVTAPLRSAINIFSGEQDHLTYPIIIIIFIKGLYLFFRTKRLTKKVKFLSVIFLCYSFLWWILGGGIIWYGLLMIPLLFAFIFRDLKRLKVQLTSDLRIYTTRLVVLLLGIWVVMAFADRVSYIDITRFNEKNAGQDIENHMLMFYSTGVFSADQVRNISAKNIAQGLQRVNSDDRYVYQVGTHLVFEVKNNNKRVFEDNTMEFMYGELQSLANPKMIVQRLKERGFGYILLDLRTPLLDRTPERTLVKKYQVFLQQIYGHPGVELVATDREVIITNNQGQKVQVNAVVGEEYIDFGNYAIYEIL